MGSFKVAKARTFLPFDRHRLLAVVENAFGTHAEFEAIVSDIILRGLRPDGPHRFRSKRLSAVGKSLNAPKPIVV